MKKILLIGVVFLAILLLTFLTKIMNKKILVVFGVILLIVLAVFIFNRINRIKNNNNNYQQNYQTSNVSVPSDVPNEYRNLYIEKVKWLDQKLIEWKPVEYKAMDFGVYHVYASDEMFIKTNSDIDAKMLDTILEVDPDTVVLYIRPGSYFSQKERYDNLINKIRSRGKKLFIGARFDDIKMSFSGSYAIPVEQYHLSV